MSEESGKTCPHCGSQLAAFALPDVLFDHEYDLACFNDECPYYVRGWAWMEQQFGVKASYRYRIDMQNGRASPISVWSSTQLRDKIMSDQARAGAAPKEHS
jgi:hypothetical protein